jgi:hypothetical protein
VYSLPSPLRPVDVDPGALGICWSSIAGELVKAPTSSVHPTNCFVEPSLRRISLHDARQMLFGASCAGQLYHTIATRPRLVVAMCQNIKASGRASSLLGEELLLVSTIADPFVII